MHELISFLVCVAQVLNRIGKDFVPFSGSFASGNSASADSNIGAMDGLVS